MATDAQLRKAGITVLYAYDLQSCTVRMTHPVGLDATSRAPNRFQARRRTLEELYGQRQQQKARRLLEKHLAGSELRTWLEMCGLAPYKSKPRTGFQQKPVKNYRRP